MTGKVRQQGDDAQARHDAAIWKTLLVNELIDVGRFEQVETVPVVFAPRISSDERFVGTGGFELYDFGAVGDGSYTKDAGFFFATGAAGLALTGTVAAARCRRHPTRRARAAADAVARWKVMDSGLVWVSQHGLSLRGRTGFYVWGWDDFLAAELVGPGALCLDGAADSGQSRWILASDWSELAFTFWARARHPQHPQFLGRTWIPPGWADRTRARGYGLPPALSGRWQPSDIQDT